FLAPLVLLVLVLAEVHDLADRRFGVGCDLDEVETGLSGDGERVREASHSQLRAVGADEANLASANAIVDAGVVCGQCGITSCRSAALAKRRRSFGKRPPSRRTSLGSSQRTRRDRDHEDRTSRAGTLSFWVASHFPRLSTRRIVQRERTVDTRKRRPPRTLLGAGRRAHRGCRR